MFFKVGFKKHITQYCSELYKIQVFLTLQHKIRLVLLKNDRPAVGIVKGNRALSEALWTVSDKVKFPLCCLYF